MSTDKEANQVMENETNQPKKKKQERKPSEPMTPKEKKVFTIIFITAGALILLVILLSIPWGGDKGKFYNEFSAVDDRDHVFEYLDYEGWQELVANKATFHILYGTDSRDSVYKGYMDRAVYEINLQFKESGISVAYYMDYTKLTADERRDVSKNTDLNISSSTNIPVLGYYQNGVRQETTSSYNITNWNNWAEVVERYLLNINIETSD